MTLSRMHSLSFALVAATLSACTQASGPSGPSPLDSTGVSQAQAPTNGTGTVTAQAAPTSVFRTTPKADDDNRIQGQAPLNVTFNMCASTDADPEDALNYSFVFGDGATAGHHCRADHMYERQGSFQATICVSDKRLADRSQICQTYGVKVKAEAEDKLPTPIAQSGSVALCTVWEKLGVHTSACPPSAFDFDSLEMVPVKDDNADLANYKAWRPSNGAIQVNTLVVREQVASVTCSASDGRRYGGGEISIAQSHATVVCLRTRAGRYVKYTARTSEGSSITIDYVAY